MNTRTWQALSVAAALCTLGLAACTDTTVEPKSTITDANIFNDPNSYRAFLAKIYGGLALSGQQGPAGQADIQGIDEGFSQYLRLYWETEELPTDEAVIAWNDIGLPEMNTQLWTSQSNMVVAMYYRIYFQVALANEFLRQTTDAKLASRGVGASLKAEIQTYRAEARFLRALSLWHAIDLFGGFQLAQAFDPMSMNNGAQFSRLYQMTATVLLFTSGGYQLVVGGLLRTFDALPLGSTLDLSAVGQSASQGLTDMFVASLQIAGPLIAVLFLADVGLGLLTRVAPALNAFALGFPLKILMTVGLGVTAYVALPQIVDSLSGKALEQMLGVTR